MLNYNNNFDKTKLIFYRYTKFGLSYLRKIK